jgi:phosphatidylethanolamine/phosphatidyl-N-methylethanolamine N-methyltransferase
MSNTLANETDSDRLPSARALAPISESTILPHKSKLYTKLARLYEGLFPFFEWQIEKGLRWHPTKPGQEVLEIGIGTGFSLKHYPQYNKVTGIDISAEMLASAQEKIKHNHWNHIQLRQMSALALELPDNSFDCVTAFHAVNVVPDPVRMMREIQRVCKPKGTFLIVNYFCGESAFGSGMGRLMDPLTRFLGWRSTLKVSQLLEGTSFEVESQRRTHQLSPYWVVFAKNRKR